MTQETRKEEIRIIRGKKVNYRYWTKEEINFLYKNSKKFSYKEIASKLGRTERSVESQLLKLNIDSRKKTRYITNSSYRSIVSKYYSEQKLKKKLRQIFSDIGIKDIEMIHRKNYGC